MSVRERGLAGVHKVSQELQSQRVSFGLRKSSFEFLWDGSKPPAENAKFLRVLGDDIMIPTQMHRFVPLSENKFFVGVCRRAFPIEAEFCHVCDVMAKAFDQETKDLDPGSEAKEARSEFFKERAKLKKRNGLVPVDVAVALAVELEPVWEGSILAGYVPKMVDFEIPAVTEGEKNQDAPVESKEYRRLLDRLGKPGTKVQVPGVGLMIGTINGKQALFDAATRKKTISDRVFQISRHGKGLDTVWEWDHEGPDQDMPDPSELLTEYKSKYPFEMPEEWAHRNGSQDRYNYFFKLKQTVAGDADASSSGSGEDEVVVAPVASSRDLLMKRVKGMIANQD